MAEDVPTRWNRPIFVASMGRSGSTLLQRVLNVHPEITIWGEHGGFLTGLLESYESIASPATAENVTDGYKSRGEVVGELANKAAFRPWVSPFTPTEVQVRLADLTRELFTNELDESIRWGFKEIRYSDRELNTLLAMFPEAHLVVLTRNFRGFAQSRFFAFGNTNFDFGSEEGREAVKIQLAKMSRRWIRRHRGLVKLRDENITRSSLIGYNDLAIGSSRPRDLFTELGEPPPSQEAIDSVLGAVSGSSFAHNSTARENRRILGELLDESRIDWEEIGTLSNQLGCHE